MGYIFFSWELHFFSSLIRMFKMDSFVWFFFFLEKINRNACFYFNIESRYPAIEFLLYLFKSDFHCDLKYSSLFFESKCFPISVYVLVVNN